MKSKGKFLTQRQSVLARVDSMVLRYDTGTCPAESVHSTHPTRLDSTLQQSRGLDVQEAVGIAITVFPVGIRTTLERDRGLHSPPKTCIRRILGCTLFQHSRAGTARFGRPLDAFAYLHLECSEPGVAWLLVDSISGRSTEMKVD